ncbi:hypothetical protein ACLBKU_17105 [Erythrobacter sp. NE805]|uniref:hypothetical protein n=1 Tax=Erythrobacter sp. NE805 TaxID=3389875 RepID=UPI00396B20B6
MTAPRRSLEEMIGELAEGLLPQLGGGAVRPVSIDLTLPVEAGLEAQADAGLRVIADLPRTHTRTDFDLPVGRLTLSLGVAAPGGLA